MKASAFLKKVKTQVTWHHTNYPLRPSYICWSITDVHADHFDQFSYKRKCELKRWIKSMLGRCGSLEGWLRVNHGIRKRHNVGYYKKTYEARIAWIDWMIAHLEAEGK